MHVRPQLTLSRFGGEFNGFIGSPSSSGGGESCPSGEEQDTDEQGRFYRDDNRLPPSEFNQPFSPDGHPSLGVKILHGVIIGIAGLALFQGGWGLFLFGRTRRWRFQGLGLVGLGLLGLCVGYAWFFGLLG